MAQPSPTNHKRRVASPPWVASTPCVVALCLAPLWLIASLALWRINLLLEMQQPQDPQEHSRFSSMPHDRHNNPYRHLQGWDPANPLAIPQGQPPNLPSIRVDGSNNDNDNAATTTTTQRSNNNHLVPQQNVDHMRKQYGGAGDKPHLGGFTQFDSKGLAPAVWRHMMTDYNIQSIMDVGCGKGVSTLWFALQGLRVLCVEGSHDAVQQSLLEPQHIVEHDYSRGPWWPRQTYDAVWSVEFLEHVGVNYHFNYISTFRKAAILFVTSSRWGGWHHVEVHMDDWWIRKYASYGFLYDHNLTQQVKYWVDREDRRNESAYAPDGKHYDPSNIGLTVKVFINPAVAALPQHAHLFFEHGCYKSFEGGVRTLRPCEAKKFESVLPRDFVPRPVDWSKHDEWHRRVKEHIAQLSSKTQTKTRV